MKKLSIESLYCSSAKSKGSINTNCEIRNTTFSKVEQKEFVALQIYDYKDLSILSFLNEVLKILSKEGYISVYYLIDLKNQDFNIKEKIFSFKENLVSIKPLGNEKYSVIYEFNNFGVSKSFFEQELNNLINMSNGIWINETPSLSFLNDNNMDDHELLRHSVTFQSNYVEIGDDGDYIQVLFKDELSSQKFIANLNNIFKISVEYIEIDCDC